VLTSADGREGIQSFIERARQSFRGGDRPILGPQGSWSDRPIGRAANTLPLALEMRK
jgi:hypothetical protein